MPDNISQQPNIIDLGIGNNQRPVSQEPILTEQDVVIHTMPSRFLVSMPSSKKAKGIGLLILTGGAFALICCIAFLYFYITKTDMPFFGKKSDVLTGDGLEPGQIPAASTSPKVADVPKPETPSKSDTASTSLAVNENIAEQIATKTPEAVNTDESANSTSTKRIKGFGTATSTAAYSYPDDADKDGFFDIEELLFDSNASLKDSDSDGYEDLAETLRLYNPAGQGGIIVNENIEKYINSTYGYSLYYPYVWQAEKINGDDSIIFKLGNNQFIQIITEPNADKKLLDDWYKQNSGNEIINNSQVLYKKGWQAIKSNDGLTVYLAKSNLNMILIMSYSLGTSNVASFKNVFDMMVNSLEIN